MAHEMVATATGILSEARMKIAEGEWIRGASKRRAVRTRGGEVMFDYHGLTVAEKIWCYCAKGAVDAAYEDLVQAAGLSGDRNAMSMPYWQGRELALQALVAAAAKTVRRSLLTGPDERLVVLINDQQIANKQQALAWFDAAIEKAVNLGEGGGG